jgi:hypothetical protein
MEKIYTDAEWSEAIKITSHLQKSENDMRMARRNTFILLSSVWGRLLSACRQHYLSSNLLITQKTLWEHFTQKCSLGKGFSFRGELCTAVRIMNPIASMPQEQTSAIIAHIEECDFCSQSYCAMSTYIRARSCPLQGHVGPATGSVAGGGGASGGDAGFDDEEGALVEKAQVCQ